MRRLIKKRKAVYKTSGRSPYWKKLKKTVQELIGKRKEKYQKSQKICLLADDAERHFLKNCKTYQTKDRPTPFDPRLLYPGKTDVEVAQALAEHFNAISKEFRPLEPSQIPSTFSSPLYHLAVHEVAARIKSIKKPKSMVKGDVLSLIHI